MAREREEWAARKEAGESYRQIAMDAGVDPMTVHRRCSKKQSSNTKSATPKRKVTKYTISQYTQPETAAVKIREKFGDGFAGKLKEAL